MLSDWDICIFFNWMNSLFISTLNWRHWTPSLEYGCVLWRTIITPNRLLHFEEFSQFVARAHGKPSTNPLCPKSTLDKTPKIPLKPVQASMQSDKTNWIILLETQCNANESSRNKKTPTFKCRCVATALPKWCSLSENNSLLLNLFFGLFFTIEKWKEEWSSSSSSVTGQFRRHHPPSGSKVISPVPVNTTIELFT